MTRAPNISDININKYKNQINKQIQDNIKKINKLNRENSSSKKDTKNDIMKMFKQFEESKNQATS